MGALSHWCVAVCLSVGITTLDTGGALQVGQNSQFTEGFDPSVYAAARADLQARKAAKAKAHTGAGGRATLTAVRACVVSVGLAPSLSAVHGRSGTLSLSCCSLRTLFTSHASSCHSRRPAAAGNFLAHNA